eukprot:5878801-Pyramimonas_sp.AAC.1
MADWAKLGKAAPKSSATREGKSRPAGSELERVREITSSSRTFTPKLRLGVKPRRERGAQSISTLLN